MVNVAIIPARGGSKRIPRKNIKLFHGKPIIAYSIEAAIQSGLFDRVIVSTDDAEIAAVSEQYGAKVPFFRPKPLSDDFTGTHAVVDHALSWIEQQGGKVNYACCIYATSPFLQIKHLEMGHVLLQEPNKTFVFSATAYPFPIQRAMYLDDNNVPYPVSKKGFYTRSQDLEESYHDAGQFYWGIPEAFTKVDNFFSDGTGIVEIPKHLVCDIDTKDDWIQAEAMYAALKKQQSTQCLA